MRQIWAIHEEGTEPAQFSEAAFRELWQHKGWRPVDVDLGAASARHGSPVTDPAQLDIDYIREVVTAQREAATPPPATPAAPAVKKKNAAPLPAATTDRNEG